MAVDPSFDRDHGKIDILTDLSSSPGRIIFRDNGLGMTQDDLESFQSTIGKSGTRAAAGDAPDVIGQFGIGFLSGFVVARRVEVTTRHWQESDSAQACRWENDGSKNYTITRCEKAEVGTEVVVELRSVDDRGLLHDDAVKGVIRDYADMLRIRIFVNDPGHHGQPANTMNMPWEREGVSDEEMRLDCMIYLEKSMPDSVLEIIRVQETGDVKVSGLLYITRTRVLGADAPRSIRVFQRRMFLCEGAKELLPPWATFVNGILNTPDLSPNAARDNFTRNENWRRLRDKLGDVIVAHFERLREQNPERLSEILAYHDLAIKAACHYYDPFFTKFGHLLEWRVNSASASVGRAERRAGRRVLSNDGEIMAYGWATLPDIISALPAVTNESGSPAPRKLGCFTTSSSANQYFEMANAAQTTVDASYPFEDELIKKYAEQHRDAVALVYVDREDDPAVFKELDADVDRSVAQLARAMSTLIRAGGSGRLRVEARRFEPPTLHAVLKDTDAGRGVRKARDILNDPNATPDLRTMAEEMLKMRMNSDIRMTINAASPLIRDLATLNYDDEDVVDLMVGVYNDAILYNQELMPPRNAKLFHEQFQRLMARGIGFVRQRDELVSERERLAKERERHKPAKSRPRDHLVAFLMTPYTEEFKPAIAGLRKLMEDEFGCELLIAADRQYQNRILENVRDHILDADVFVADVTGANPNVMHELGAARYGRPGCPVMLVNRRENREDAPALPTDLAGHIVASYPAEADSVAIADALRDAFRNHVTFSDELKNHSRQEFVSARKLESILGESIKLSADAFYTLSREFPTAGAWQSVQSDQVAALLGAEFQDLAPVILKRVQEATAHDRAV
ncbi:MAG: ATP-binding protein [Planctomycetaceae bacterium]|nr:ATP-binding protein [Planctomycetaceae bacterium]MCB9951830.1 ATP-binding protein [Planctomycetaceae bacterium]